MKIKNEHYVVIYVVSILLTIFLTRLLTLPKNPAPNYSFQLNKKESLNKDVITCEFQTFAYFEYSSKKYNDDDNKKIIFNFNSKAKEVSSITFVDLATKKPKMKGNFGLGDLILAQNNSTKIVLLERNMIGNIISYYTIFKKEKIAVWHKAYNMMSDLPYSYTSMGYCY